MQFCVVCENIQTMYSEKLDTVNSLAVRTVQASFASLNTTKRKV
jgi:nitrate/TMAO reductase-like tetraheme cytochrome c subunit